METIYLDTVVWVREYYLFKKKKKRPKNFPNISKYSPKKAFIILSPLALFEIESKLIDNEKIKKFCNKNPHIDIFRKRRDIDIMKISDKKLKSIKEDLQEILINRIPSAFSNIKIPNIKTQVAEGLIQKCLFFNISFIDLLHVYLSDEYKCGRFVTEDIPLIRSLLRMKRKMGLPNAIVSHSKSLSQMERKFIAR